MRCDVCDQEVANSEELKAHMERMHPIDEPKDEELEKPDHLDADPEEPVVVRPGGLPQPR